MNYTAVLLANTLKMKSKKERDTVIRQWYRLPGCVEAISMAWRNKILSPPGDCGLELGSAMPTYEFLTFFGTLRLLKDAVGCVGTG